MNRLSLIALVENLKSNGFTTPVEKLLAFVLAFIDTEGKSLQQCEIIKIPELGEKHCRNTLDKFVETEGGQVPACAGMTRFLQNLQSD